MNKPLNILVTGVGGPAGINSCRLLKQESNVTIIGADIDPLSAGKFFTHEFILSPRVSDVTLYVQWLQKIIIDKAIDIIIPTVHEELVVLDSVRDSLSCAVILSSHESIRCGDDKFVCYEWASQHLPDNVAKTTTLNDWSLNWSNQETQFIKPRQGRGARGCLTALKTDIAHLQTQANGIDILVMELLPGTEWTVDAYRSVTGEMVYVVPRERIGLAGGISIKGKTVKNELVGSLTKKMCELLDCRGPVCIQWKADAAGVPRLLEINPRLSGGLPISVMAGVNPIKALLAEYRQEALLPQVWKEVTSIGYFEYKEV